MRTRTRRLAGRTLLGLLLLAPLVAGGGSVLLAPAPTGSGDAGYLAPDAAPVGPSDRYAAPAARPEPATFGIDELRRTLTGAAPDRYVDLGRFRDLRRGADDAR